MTTLSVIANREQLAINCNNDINDTAVNLRSRATNCFQCVPKIPLLGPITYCWCFFLRIMYNCT